MSGDRLANQQSLPSVINARAIEKSSSVEGNAAGIGSVGMDAKVKSTSSQGTVSGPSRNSSLDLDKMTRPKRKRINPQQLQSLLAIFAQTDTPSYELRESVGAELGMSNREVQVWFQNRRAKERATRQRSQTSAQDEEEKLEKAVGLSSQAQYQIPLPSTSSYSGFPISSPPQRVLAFASDLDYGRRRSLSTGNMVESKPPAVAMGWLQTGQPNEPERESRSSAGPMRPRVSRYHTYSSYYAPVSPARAGSWTSRPPMGSRPSFQTEPKSPSYSQYSSSPSQPSTSYTFPARNARETISESASQLERIPSTETLADRRNTRLPPVKLLLDIADMASLGISPPEPPYSAQSCPPLSPFGGLSLYSPMYPRSGYSEGATSCYFDAKTPTGSTRISPQSEGAASDRFGMKREDSL